MISVVVPAYNEEKVIGRLLKSLANTGYKDYEVIVVDDGSTDRTSFIAMKHGAKVIKGSHRGVGFARNVGWKNAKGDVVVFLDADMEVKRDFFEKVAEWMKLYDAIDFKSVLGNSDKLLARLSFLRHRIYFGSFAFVRAVKRKVIEEVGGYNPMYGYYDDWELALRVKNSGYKVGISDVEVITYEPENFAEVFRKARWEGRSIPSFLKGFKLRFLKAYGYCALNFFAFLPFVNIFWLIVEIYRSLVAFWKTGEIESFLLPFYDWLTGSVAFIYATIRGEAKA